MPTPDVVKQYPKWFTDMLQDILDMRDAQKEFFKHRGEYRKRVAIAKEQRADQHLEHFVHHGLICHRQKETQQTNKLF